MCSPTAAVGVVGAIGQAQAVSQANKQKKREYEYKMKIREAKWLRDSRLYDTKKVQYEQNVVNANIAAQRAYTKSQISMNNAVAQAMLDNNADFAKMLEAEGMIEAGAAERGVRGKSVMKQLLMNKQKYRMGQSMRRRALTEASYRLKAGNESTNIKLKSTLNQQFGKVAIQPWEGIPEPPPVMGNPGMTLMLGVAGSVAGEFGSGGAFENSFGGGKTYSNTSFNGMNVYGPFYVPPSLNTRSVYGLP